MPDDDLHHLRTERLLLDAPRERDLDALHAIYADPRVWTHFPALRHTDPSRTREMLGRWIEVWERDGLGPWMVRSRDRPHGSDGPLLGHGGVDLREGAFWNLGYRLAAEAHGHGYATEVARAGVAAARRHRGEVPVIAYLLEHNHASRRVAEKVGLALRLRGPDAGNPDPEAVRLVLADRPLEAAQEAAALR